MAVEPWFLDVIEKVEATATKRTGPGLTTRVAAFVTPPEAP